MAGSANIVAELLGGIMNPESTRRLERALGSGGLSSPDNPLANILQSLQGQQGGGRGAPTTGVGGFGGLADLAQRILGQMTSSPAAAGGAGALAGLLLGGGKGAMRGGVLAALGSIAASALAKSGRAQAPATPDALPGSMRAAVADPEEDPVLSDRADLLLEAMVLAAKSDGRLDRDEVEHIRGKMAEDGLDQAEMTRFAELARGSAGLDDLVARIPDPQTAAEVYVASLLAIRVDTEAERRHLTALAERSGLDPETVAELHRLVGLA
jgi:uncharacterized membrane protein YebE (DUF533 family)